MSVFSSLETLDRLARRIVEDYIVENDVRTHQKIKQADVLNAEDAFRNMLNGPGIVNGLVENMTEMFVSRSGGVEDE